MEAKYEREYSASIDPFAAWRSKERERGRAAMAVHDRMLYAAAQMVATNPCAPQVPSCVRRLGTARGGQTFRLRVWHCSFPCNSMSPGILKHFRASLPPVCLLQSAVVTLAPSAARLSQVRALVRAGLRGAPALHGLHAALAGVAPPCDGGAAVRAAAPYGARAGRLRAPHFGPDSDGHSARHGQWRSGRQWSGERDGSGTRADCGECGGSAVAVGLGGSARPCKPGSIAFGAQGLVSSLRSGLLGLCSIAA